MCWFQMFDRHHMYKDGCELEDDLFSGWSATSCNEDSVKQGVMCCASGMCKKIMKSWN
jgi:hypothetical protein